MAQSDLIKFWQLLDNTKFTDNPSKLSAEDLRRMGKVVGLTEDEIAAVLRGFLESLKQAA